MDTNDDSDSALNAVAHFRKWRKRADLTMQELADLMETSKAQVQRIENGTRRFNNDYIENMAKALNVGIHDLFTDPLKTVQSSILKITVKGAVEAGIEREALEWDYDAQYTLNIPLPELYDMAKPFALEVRGQSMNKVYENGSILICASLYNLGEEPISEKRYIVHRKTDTDHYEATVKTLRIDEAGACWLWPESTDPNFQTPTKVNGNEGDEIVIAARVIGVFSPQ